MRVLNALIVVFTLTASIALLAKVTPGVQTDHVAPTAIEDLV